MMDTSPYLWKEISDDLQARVLDIEPKDQQIQILFEVKIVSEKSSLLYEIKRDFILLQQLVQDLLELTLLPDIHKLSQLDFSPYLRMPEAEELPGWLKKVHFLVVDCLESLRSVNEVGCQDLILEFFNKNSGKKSISNPTNESLCDPRLSKIKETECDISIDGTKKSGWTTRLIRRLSNHSLRGEVQEDKVKSVDITLQRSKTDIDLTKLSKIQHNPFTVVRSHSSTEELAQRKQTSPPVSPKIKQLINQSAKPEPKLSKSKSFFGGRLSSFRTKSQLDFKKFTQNKNKETSIYSTQMEFHSINNIKTSSKPKSTLQKYQSQLLHKANSNDSSPVSSPTLSRSKTIKERLLRTNTKVQPKDTISDVIELLIFLSQGTELPQELKLNVTKNISYDRLLRGIKNKALLTGFSLPEEETFQLFFLKDGSRHLLKSDNIDEFFAEEDRTIWLGFSDDEKRLSYLDLDKNNQSQNSIEIQDQTNRLSKMYSGLNLEVSKPTNKIRHRQFKTSLDIRNFLLSPAEAKAKFHILDEFEEIEEDKLKLDLDKEKEEEEEEEEEEQIVIEKTVKVWPGAVDYRRKTVANLERRNLPPNQLKTTILSIHNQADMLNRKNTLPTQLPAHLLPSLTRQLSIPLNSKAYIPNQDGLTSQILNQQNYHVKALVTINKEYSIKLDVEEYSTTLTSIMNRAITKFSKGGYPLAKLRTMKLIYCFSNNSSSRGHMSTLGLPLISPIKSISLPTVMPSRSNILTIENTDDLKKCLEHAKANQLKNITLLMVPGVLLDPKRHRMGLRWEHPPDLMKLEKGLA